jgi:hypothetical protein
MRLFLLFFFSLLAFNSQALGFSAEIGLEGRFYPQDQPSTVNDYADQVGNASLHLAAEWLQALEGISASAHVEVKAAVDQHDSERSIVDLAEANLQWQGDDWTLKAGFSTVFWGVTESQHLVDIVNQVNWAENLDSEDKLGQPMLNLQISKDWGELSLFVLPGFRERVFPGSDARPGFNAEVKDAEYESAAEEKHTDLALRYSRQLDNVDVGVSWFHGTAREPRIINDEQGHLRPYYEQIDQLGVDVQATTEAWLLKLEAIYRKGQGKDFYALATGLEYSVFSLAGGDTDLGLILEYTQDSRTVLQSEEGYARPLASLRLFEEAVFAGLRVALNDVDSSELLVGCASDLDSAAWFCTLEGSRRLGEHMQLALEGRVFDNLAQDTAFSAVQRDDYIALRVSWFL